VILPALSFCPFDRLCRLSYLKIIELWTVSYNVCSWDRTLKISQNVGRNSSEWLFLQKACLWKGLSVIAHYNVIGSCVRVFDWYWNQRPWMTLNTYCSLSVTNVRLSELTNRDVSEDRRLISTTEIALYTPCIFGISHQDDRGMAQFPFYSTAFLLNR